jgi:type I restriction enzyme M protein
MGEIDDRQQHLRFDKLVAEDEVRAAIYRTLEEIREILHRGSRLSSRHECLDEVSKLLFAHVTLVDRGEAGLGPAAVPPGEDAALALCELVSQTLRAGLPESLSHELDPSAYTLRLQQGEAQLASELVRCFEEHCPGEALRQMRRAGELDLLNDTFGQFLADSFSDEKELGQYLTPIEVVRFMVRLGLSSLSQEDLAALTDPAAGDEAGVILDPACGVGSFLAETVRALYARRRRATENEPEREALVEHLMRFVLVGVDKSERMIRLCLTNLALFGAPSANLYLQNSLARRGAAAEVTKALVGRARLILTNPPFGAEFSGEALEPFRLFDTWARRRPRTIDSELLFLERYIDWLAPGGVLVAVVPDSILTNRGIFEDLRAGIAPGVEVLSVVSLPKATFGVAGTDTKTSVLHLRKVEVAEAAARPTYFGICQSLGYDVSARGAQRKKVASGDNDLVLMSDEAARQARPRKGRLVDFSTAEARWDATYHAGLPLDVAKRLGRGAEHLRVRDVAALATARIDPREGEGKSFDYIEISGIDASTLSVRARAIRRGKAPGRARKPVLRGDVLVSTVRPERRTVGVVPPSLDGAVCSTGLAVLRCAEGVDPRVLARLLQSDFANAQVLRNNVGIAYPAIDEACLAWIVLPLQAAALEGLAELAVGVERARAALDEAEGAFSSAVSAATKAWEG